MTSCSDRSISRISRSSDPSGISRRLQAVQAPIIRRVNEILRACPEAISFGHGMVSYGPPPQSEVRLRGFFDEPSHHAYGAGPGEAELLAALTGKLRVENGIEVGEERRLWVTAGSNMAFLQVVLAIADPGDEIVLLSPYYFNHEMAVRIADCRPVAVATDGAHQPVVPALRAALSERTRAIVTISPNNPTGAVYPRETLAEIDRLCREKGLFHLSDEAYEYFTYEGAEHVSAGSLPGAGDHTVSFYSLSKSYGFAGWRIGYAVIPARIEPALSKIQDTNLICPPVVSQHAAAGALEAGAAYCRRHVAELAEVRAVVLEGLSGLGSILARPLVADGAFYVFLDLDAAHDDFELNERLIREFGVGALPGRAFGEEGRCTLRVSYGALDRDTAREGTKRLVRGLRAIVG